MTTSDIVDHYTGKLKCFGVPTARLDVLVMLEDASGLSRSTLLAHPELELTTIQARKLQTMIDERAKHVPLAYIRGKTEFYGREFIVNEHVLEPRPESETMIELLKTLVLPEQLLIADVGTGSGALGITAALEIKGAHVDLIDIDSGALAVSQQNTQRHAVAANCIKSDLLPTPTASYDLILANLPYVPDDYQINKAASYEPRMAIFGGPDGLELYRRLFAQISNLTAKPPFILAESIPFQHPALREIALKAGYPLQVEDDFIQLFTLQQTNA